MFFFLANYQPSRLLQDTTIKSSLQVCFESKSIRVEMIVDQTCRRGWIYIWVTAAYALVMGCDQNFRELRIKSERDFAYHHLHETEICEWLFSPFIMILKKRSKCLRKLIWNRWNSWNLLWTGFHNLELKWNLILWNAKNCFQAWIFRECEFTDPSLINVQAL